MRRLGSRSVVAGGEEEVEEVGGEGGDVGGEHGDDHAISFARLCTARMKSANDNRYIYR